MTSQIFSWKHKSVTPGICAQFRSILMANPIKVDPGKRRLKGATLAHAPSVPATLASSFPLPGMFFLQYTYIPPSLSSFSSVQMSPFQRELLWPPYLNKVGPLSCSLLTLLYFSQTTYIWLGWFWCGWENSDTASVLSETGKRRLWEEPSEGRRGRVSVCLARLEDWGRPPSSGLWLKRQDHLLCIIANLLKRDL